MQYLCNTHDLSQFYPKDAGQRAMLDSAMFYLIGTLYPLVARPTYPTLGFPQYAGEVGSSDADSELKTTAQSDAASAIAQPLEAYRVFFLDGKPFIGGDSPSIADIRLAATLEFLHAIDYEFPAWAKDYLTANGPTANDVTHQEDAIDLGAVEHDHVAKSAANHLRGCSPERPVSRRVHHVRLTS
jgi:glutathione S-transferase